MFFDNSHSTDLGDFYQLRQEETEWGACTVIDEKHFIHFVDSDWDYVTQQLASNLELLPGLGPKKTQQLKAKGFDSLFELREHDRLGEAATTLLAHIEGRDGPALYQHLKASGKKFSSRHPVFIHNASFFDLNKVSFLDIETMGLFGSPLFLIGLGSLDGEDFNMELLFMNDPGEEKAVLSHMLDILATKEAVFTFNGISFDIPFINNRLAYHGFEERVNLPHFDVLQLARSHWQYELQRFKLTALEQSLLNFEREGDIPSALVPRYYMNYLDSGDIKPLLPVLEHNKWDVASTAEIMLKMIDDVNKPFFD